MAVRSRRPGLEQQRHAHLWQLPDGTRLHAPVGELRRDPDTGAVCCHLCGRWFQALGSHLRVHGYTADEYRSAFGLYRSRPLTASMLSAAWSERTRVAYAGSPRLRRQLAPGRALAASGELNRRARAGLAGGEPAQRHEEQQRRLAAGRATRTRRAEQAVAGRLSALGAADLACYLRTAYAGGANLDQLREATGGPGPAVPGTDRSRSDPPPGGSHHPCRQEIAGLGQRRGGCGPGRDRRRGPLARCAAPRRLVLPAAGRRGGAQQPLGALAGGRVGAGNTRTDEHWDGHPPTRRPASSADPRSRCPLAAATVSTLPRIGPEQNRARPLAGAAPDRRGPGAARRHPLLETVGGGRELHPATEDQHHAQCDDHSIR